METVHDITIVGGGLSGLAAAHFIRKLAPGRSCLILEKSDRPGGAIRSFRDSGYLAEWGPHGFLNNTEASQEIVRDTGLDAKVQRAPLGNFLRFICHGGRLVPLPQNPKILLSTPLLTFRQKLRLAGDLFIAPVPDDQSVGYWAARRFGEGVLPLIDAAVTGTFAGDYERMSINAVMPGLRQTELEAGSVLRGLKRKKKLAGTSPGDLPAMQNFPGGMEQLIKAMAQKHDIRYGVLVTSLVKDGETWTMETNSGQIRTKDVVVALPVNPALDLLSGLSAPPLREAPLARLANVVMGFSSVANVPRGFGYLAPEKENRFTMGVMFSSHMFPDRAPAGKVLVEALVGGRRHPERLELADEEMIEKVYADIRGLINLPQRPEFVRVLRSPDGIPQMEMQHTRLLGWLEDLLKKEKGLYVSGFGWEGIGINDMTKGAKKIADAIAKGDRPQPAPLQIKPIYF